MVSPLKTPSDESLSPPHLPSVPPNAMPEMVESVHEKRTAMTRPSFGSEGQHIQLLTNHFTVNLKAQDQFFCKYNISIKSVDNVMVVGKAIGRKVMDRLYQTYCEELGGKEFAYDGGDSLFTVGSLPKSNFDFVVVLEESTRLPCGCTGDESPCADTRKKLSKHSFNEKTVSVQISYATKIPLSAVSMFHRESETDHRQDALRVLDMILRQQQARRGCLLVRQSYFDSDPANFTDLGGGVTVCRGFHSNFRATCGGLFLNMDVSSSIILKPGPVIDFLIANQNVRNAKEVNWAKAKRTLKNMRIKTIHTNMEFKIIGLTSLPCSQQTFTLKGKIGDGKDLLPLEVTVFNYFKEKCIALTWSSSLPCLVVGKPRLPIYLPIELCNLISLQRYTKALSPQLRASLVEKSRQKPQERIRAVTNEFQKNQYNDEPLISSCGITIEKQLAQIDGRILKAPTLKIGNEEDCCPKNGRWNFTNKKFLQAIPIDSWAIVNFSARCDISHLSREMIKCARNKGITINRPFTIIEENHQYVRMEPAIRVEKMFEEVIKRLPCPPQLLLCVLPEKKNSAIYGPWKKKNLVEMGIVTQCISPTKITDHYLTNVLLKINAKLGGINSLLAVEANPSIPLVTDVPTMIVGMDVCHGSSGHDDFLSVAVAVGSRNWPIISRYGASVRTQSAKLEIIDSLYKPLSNGEDDGMMRDLLLDFYDSSRGRKPAQIIIFRDGVSESQFSQVLNIELDQIIKAFQHLGEGPLPKFTIIISQKNHQAKFFQADSAENVPPGTVVDTRIVHPRNYDFYMCSQAGMIGTTRPTHYHVLLDEIGFSPDDLQNLVHSLSYVYQRSTSAISIVAPIRYARLAAHQMSHFIKFEDLLETSNQDCEGGNSVIPEMPRLHEEVRCEGPLPLWWT